MRREGPSCVGMSVPTLGGGYRNSTMRRSENFSSCAQEREGPTVSPSRSLSWLSIFLKFSRIDCVSYHDTVISGIKKCIGHQRWPVFRRKARQIETFPGLRVWRLCVSWQKRRRCQFSCAGLIFAIFLDLINFPWLIRTLLGLLPHRVIVF